MLYLSLDYILSSIEQLATAHSFIGITFLACKKELLPIGSTTNFPMDNITKNFMNRIHKICPDSSYYFQPFQTIRSKKWVAEKYPSSGLQSLNTRTFKDSFLHEKDNQIWGWAPNYIEEIAKAAFRAKKKKVSIAALAVWIFKNDEWKDTDTLEDVVNKFVSSFHITEQELKLLFSTDSNFPNVPVFQNTKVTWTQLADFISSPPDAEPDNEGTLSKLELINVGPCDHAQMFLAPRLNIVTGDNGLGKTFLMDCAWWALTNTWAGNEARPKYPEGKRTVSISFSIAGKSKIASEQTILYDNKNLTWARSENTETIPGLIIYAIVDGSYAVWDPSKTGTQGKPSYIFTKRQVWDGQDSSIEGLIRDWVKWQNTPEKYPFQIFKKVLKRMSPPDLGTLIPGLPMRVPNDIREIPTISYSYGTVPVTNASAGIGRIVTLAYLMVWAWNEHKENSKMRGIKPNSRIVLMIDELEAHLHPKWQRTILPALLEVQNYLSTELEVQVIISTHSPLIMASVETIFNPITDKLFQIKISSESQNAILTEENFIKYGQINNWLTSSIFNLGQARSTEAEKAIEEAKQIQLATVQPKEAVENIHKKLLNCLAQNDSFWPRWIYFAEQHGVSI